MQVLMFPPGVYTGMWSMRVEGDDLNTWQAVEAKQIAQQGTIGESDWA